MKSSKRLKHLLTMVLSMLMLFSAILVSCADNGQKQPSDDSASTSSSDTVSDDNDRLNISDNLPKTDMDGYELRFLVREGIDESLTLNDEKAEDVIDEAVYNRQLYIQERFNCKLSKVLLQEGAADSELNGKVISNVSVDDNEFQIVIGSTGSTPLATEGYLATWETAPNVDFDKPWWNKTANDSLTINGNSFFAFGDINYWLIFQTNCLYFNKQLIEDYQMEDPYQVVLDGRWTLDYLSNISKQYYKDLNNDNARDIDDFYVYTVDVASGLSSYQNSTQNLMYKKDSDDIPVFSAATQRMGNLIENDACALGAGAFSEGDLCIIAGTWSINEYISKAPVKGAAMNSFWCVDGCYLAEESSAASAGNLEWMRNILKDRSYRELDDLAEGVLAEKSAAVFLPFLYASNLDPMAKASLVGLESGYGEGEVIRAIYEGVAFSGYTHLERLLNSMETSPKRLKLAGGVVNSPLGHRCLLMWLEFPLKRRKRQSWAVRGLLCRRGSQREFIRMRKMQLVPVFDPVGLSFPIRT